MILFVSFAKAQTATPVVTDRQINQQQRIRQGKRSGELTPTENARFQGQQVKICRDKGATKSDGTVTGQERAKLRWEQKRANPTITRKKNNSRTK